MNPMTSMHQGWHALSPRRACSAIVAALVCASAIAARDDNLTAKLQPLIDAHQGQVAVAVKHLATGETFTHRADEPMPTASLIKFPVMVEAYRQADEGKLDLKKMLTLRDEDKVPGAGVLSPHFSAGTTLSVRDAIRLMIVYSDNTATNLVLDRIGLPATARTMESLGLVNTKIHAKVYRRDTSIFPDRSQQFGLGSTTANEMIKLLEMLHQRKLVSQKASEAMLDHLAHCEDKTKLAAKLPPGTKLAHKSGTVSDIRCDAGILTAPAGPVALCVLTRKNKDQRWADDNAAQVLCGAIGRAVYDHFGEAKSGATKTTAP
jgi:beta-lactamase class A